MLTEKYSLCRFWYCVAEQKNLVNYLN